MTWRPEPIEARIQQYCSGDFARLVAGISTVCGSRAVAEELVQDALVKAWEQEMRGEPIDSLGAWVATVALNRARSSRRRVIAELRARRLQLVHGDFQGSRAQLGQVEQRIDLVRAIGSLPRRQREVVVLHYFLDMAGPEISKVLDVSAGSVRVTLSRARRTLAAALGERERSIEQKGSSDAGPR